MKRQPCRQHRVPPLQRTQGRGTHVPKGNRKKSERAGHPPGFFRVETYLDFGGRLPLRYSHKIIARNGQPLCETSLLHWHGIATETAWDSVGPKDTDSSVE